MTVNKRLPGIVIAACYMVFFVLFFYALIITKYFLYPIALAVLFAYLLYPVANFFENKLHFPRILANLITLILAVVLLAGVIVFIYKQLSMMIHDLGALKTKALENLFMLEKSVQSKTGIHTDKQQEWIKQGVDAIFQGGSELFGFVFTSTTGTIARMILIPIFVFFFLYYRDKFYEFIIRATKPRNQKVVKTILEEVSGVTKNYMGGVFIVVTILCITNSLGLWIIGVEFAILLGIITAICNFIPYFGTILGFSFVLLFTLLTGDSPSQLLGVVALFIIILFTEHNILTPNIVGGNVKLNPIVIILSLIVGAMVWGIPGMLVVVPVMAVLRIVADNIKGYQPIAFLLGVEGTEKHSLTIKKIKSLFQKKKIQQEKKSETSDNN